MENSGNNFNPDPTVYTTTVVALPLNFGGQVTGPTDSAHLNGRMSVDTTPSTIQDLENSMQGLLIPQDPNQQSMNSTDVQQNVQLDGRVESANIPVNGTGNQNMQLVPSTMGIPLVSHLNGTNTGNFYSDRFPYPGIAQGPGILTQQIFLPLAGSVARSPLIIHQPRRFAFQHVVRNDTLFRPPFLNMYPVMPTPAYPPGPIHLTRPAFPQHYVVGPRTAGVFGSWGNDPRMTSKPAPVWTIPDYSLASTVMSGFEPPRPLLAPGFPMIPGWCPPVFRQPGAGLLPTPPFVPRLPIMNTPTPQRSQFHPRRPKKDNRRKKREDRNKNFTTSAPGQQLHQPNKKPVGIAKEWANAAVAESENVDPDPQTLQRVQTLEASGGGEKAVVVQKRKLPSPGICKLCRSNGELPSFYKNHVTHDEHGVAQCPVLRALRCPICGATGDYAHTIKYCPKKKGHQEDTSSETSRFPINRTAAGGYTFGKY